ncbi:hypothetical protein B0J11DRAFT_507918 [Dendryphion nanum]|uniref:Uncharacterized protein n=1 Tax=Dendryphion nanum TaxID=256645 RepID=A0A9P9IHJ8_9PLEO|nr:hypothetical protein B0J11DRAFT_507918 [Dendryphion nanum]
MDDFDDEPAHFTRQESLSHFQAVRVMGMIGRVECDERRQRIYQQFDRKLLLEQVYTFPQFWDKCTIPQLCLGDFLGNPARGCKVVAKGWGAFAGIWIGMTGGLIVMGERTVLVDFLYTQRNAFDTKSRVR